MKLAILIPPNAEELPQLAAQMGVKLVITKAAQELSGLKPPHNYESLKALKDKFGRFGLSLCGLEGDQFDMNAIKLGLPARDEHIELYAQMLRNMGRLGMDLFCLNWMACVGWFRTNSDTPARGGATTTSFSLDKLTQKKKNARIEISESDLRKNLDYFLDAVLPVAESEGVKMALHPDDPPISPFCGVGRILKSSADYENVFARHNSENLGVAFCQATFKLAGENLKNLSANWIKRKKIFFIHIRDTIGTAENFTEVFIDENRGFISEMLAHYAACGFDGYVRSDHAPAMGSERQPSFASGVSAGYQPTGHVFSYGYIKGCCDTLKIPLQ